MPKALPLVAGLLTALPLSAAAQQSPRPAAPAMVQQVASGDYWIDPSTGCSYARTHVPGWPPSWHLIRNGTQIGLTDARPHCAITLRAGG